MAQSVPIFVVHRGNPPYLRLVLNQFQKTSPDARLILLGDESNEHLPGVEHVNCASLEDEDVWKFRAIYQHASILAMPFERFCIERWFLLRNFVRKEGLKSLIHVDSDVLPFADIREMLALAGDSEITFSRWDAKRLIMHFMIVRNVELLEQFCRFVLDLYEDSARFENLRRRSLCCPRKNSKPWISDMNLFHEFHQAVPMKAFFWEDALAKGVLVDSRLTQSESLQANWGLIRKQRIKKIRFIQGLPVAFLKDGTSLSVKALHYHSYAKYLIRWHSQKKDGFWPFFFHTLFFEHKLLKKFTNK